MSYVCTCCGQAQKIGDAKQLAAINFLREVMGTREHRLESFIADICQNPVMGTLYGSLLQKQRICPGGAVMDIKKFEVRVNFTGQDVLYWCAEVFLIPCKL